MRLGSLQAKRPGGAVLKREQNPIASRQSTVLAKILNCGACAARRPRPPAGDCRRFGQRTATASRYSAPLRETSPPGHVLGGEKPQNQF
jgi:hypothetical protein